MDKLVVIVLVNRVGSQGAVEGRVNLLDLVHLLHSRVFCLVSLVSGLRAGEPSGWGNCRAGKSLFGKHRWYELVGVRLEVDDVLLLGVGGAPVFGTAGRVEGPGLGAGAH